MYYLRWFDATHERGLHGWQRIGFVSPGSVGEQDAVLMDAMDFLRGLHNELLLGPVKDTDA